MSTAQTLPKQNHQAPQSIPYDHGTISANGSVKIWGAKGRNFRIDRVWYNNVTGYTQDATDYYVIEITDGTNVLASWSSLTGADGTLTANTPVELNIAAAHDLAAGSTLTVTFVKHASAANLPAGRFVVDGRYL